MPHIFARLSPNVSPIGQASDLCHEVLTWKPANNRTQYWWWPTARILVPFPCSLIPCTLLSIKLACAFFQQLKHFPLWVFFMLWQQDFYHAVKHTILLWIIPFVTLLLPNPNLFGITPSAFLTHLKLTIFLNLSCGSSSMSCFCFSRYIHGLVSGLLWAWSGLHLGLRWAKCGLDAGLSGFWWILGTFTYESRKVLNSKSFSVPASWIKPCILGQPCSAMHLRLVTHQRLCCTGTVRDEVCRRRGRRVSRNRSRFPGGAGGSCVVRRPSRNTSQSCLCPQPWTPFLFENRIFFPGREFILR